MNDVAILAPVYHPYRWVAPFLQEYLGRFWPEHPPLFFCGLTAAEAGALPCLPIADEGLPRDWASFVRDAVEELQQRGFKKCYLLLEEHLPLAECHATHLNVTLPRLLDDWDAAYIGLMGWDNRRYAFRAPILSAAQHAMMHLSIPRAPRFHLHPSLWRLEPLRDCLELVLRDPVHTPWRFEKITDKIDADLPARWKNGCYQICGRMLAINPPSATARIGQALERFFYHKLMALYPLFRVTGTGRAFWDLLGFDAFFYNGPYPMFFSGVMAKGGINPHFVRFVRKHPQFRRACAELMAASAAAEKDWNPGFSSKSQPA